MQKKQKLLKFGLGLLSIFIIATSGVVLFQENKSMNQVNDLASNFVSSYTTHSPIFIDTNSDFVSQGYPGNGSLINPYLISGFNITTTGVCIRIQDTTAHFIIRDCILSGGTDNRGIELDYANNGVIRNNTVIGKLDGIQLDHSEYNMVLNNTFIDNSLSGVDLYKYSHYNVVANNTAIGHQGVKAHSSYYNTIANNTVFANTDVGIGNIACKDNVIEFNTILNDRVGVFISGSNNITVANNTITDGELGIYHYSGDNNTIANNTIVEGITGISLGPTSDNTTIYLNVFAYCTTINAIDEGRGTMWNFTTKGNYWSDYIGTGVYSISGAGGGIDYHPFSYDTRAPTINHPLDLEFTEGTTGHSITWNATDFHPSHYQVLDNGTEITSDTWSGDLITVTIDGFDVGTHYITIIVYDTFGLTTTDLVIVTISSQQTTPTTPPATFPALDTMTIVLIGGLIGVIVIVIIIVRFKRG